MKILTLCTANVARSVMLAFMLATLAEAEGRDWELRSAGTHALEGLSMSPRTLSALESLGELGEHRYDAHHTHQVTAFDVDWADVVLAMEADHVRYLNGLNEQLASRTVSFAHFVRQAPIDRALSEQIAFVRALGLSDADDVADPGDGDASLYLSCATELWELAQAFAAVVSDH